MNEFLIDYAIKNVWCDPTRDHQQAFRTIRLTDKRGDMIVTNIHRDTVKLPDSTSRWMVYQVGGINANRINIPTVKWEWFRVDELCEQRQMLIDVYTDTGIQLNKSECHIFYSHGGGLFVAVKVNSFYCNFEKAEVYIRFYTGRGFEISKRGEYGCVRVFNEQMEDTSHVGLLKMTVDTLKQHHEGAVLCYVNGRYVDEVSLKYIRRNDYVEVFFDPSVYKVIDFDIKDLRVFNSSLDNERKYLIHPLKDGHEWIDYVDDIDVYLIKKVAGRVTGVYYHHSQHKWMRQLTHRDYAIPIEKIRGLFETHSADKTHLNDVDYPEQNWGHLEELSLRFFFRQPGYDRPLVDTAERIHDLYRLNDDDILNCMAGIDSNIEFWKAEYLEKANYPKFMGMLPEDIYVQQYGLEDKTSPQKESVEDLVGGIFGYHGCSKILADTPSLVKKVGEHQLAPLAYEYWNDATVYEYDNEGLLLGHYHTSVEDMYHVHNENARLIETLSGEPGKNYSRSDEENSFTLTRGYNYRICVCTIRRGEPQYDWKDVTYDSTLDQYGAWSIDTDNRKKWTWALDAKKQLGIVVSDQCFIQETLTLDGRNGLLSFLLTNNTTGIHIPLRYLDIWVNGRSLQPGLDYTVLWPRVVLHCADYLRQDTTEQTVSYRAYGLPDLNFAIEADTEIGFVEHDRLSRDGKFFFYDTRVVRITVDGRTVHRDDVVFDEDDNQYKISGVRNGAPYSVKCVTRTLRDVFEDDELAKQQDDERNEITSAYLSLKLPQHEYPDVDFTDYQYNVISCFANRILHDLMRGLNLPPWIEKHYSERDIAEWYDSYTWLLSFDIAQRDYDKQHIKVIPHWYNDSILLPYYRYTLFRRILKHFLNIEIDLSNYVKVEEVERLP